MIHAIKAVTGKSNAASEGPTQTMQISSFKLNLRIKFLEFDLTFF